MKHFTKLIKIAFIAITMFTAISCDEDDDNVIIIDDGNPMTNTIADFVTANADYSSLLAALQQTGLDATLDGDGPFTVFAPNNEAFDAFLDGTPLSEVDNDALTQILLNHVIGSSVTADALTTGYVKNLATEPTSGANIDVYVDTTTGVVLNGQSTVTTADIAVDNGVIHAVSDVIALPTIVTFATTNPALTSLVAALTDEGNTTFTTLLSDLNQDL